MKGLYFDEKIFLLAIICLFLLPALLVPSYAMSEDSYERPIVEEPYAYLANAWAGLTPTGSGWYSVLGGAGSIHNDMNIKVTVTIQKYVRDTGWVTLQTWYGEGYYSASAGGTRCILTSGTYRTHMEAAIYKANGTLGETVAINSDHLIIP